MKEEIQCQKCNHIILKKFRNGKQTCLFCSGRTFCDSSDCTFCNQNSFASFDLFAKSLKWSDQNDIIPRKISKSSGQEFLFDCTIC